MNIQSLSLWFVRGEPSCLAQLQGDLHLFSVDVFCLSELQNERLSHFKVVILKFVEPIRAHRHCWRLVNYAAVAPVTLLLTLILLLGGWLNVVFVFLNDFEFLCFYYKILGLHRLRFPQLASFAFCFVKTCLLAKHSVEEGHVDYR